MLQQQRENSALIPPTCLVWAGSDSNADEGLMQNQINLLICQILILPTSQLLSHFLPATEVVKKDDDSHSQEH